MVPKVSIIVPCWGVEKYLNKTVTCLLNQTLSDIEIILIDDESPDRVPEICDDWAQKDSRIKVVHKKNEGLGMACNSGIEVATGEYLAFCDSDDWVEHDTYEKMYNTALSKKADLVMTSFKYVNMDGTLSNRDSLTYSDIVYHNLEIQEVMKGIIASSPSCSCERQFQASAKVTLYRHSIIKDNGLQFVSERLIPSEDLIFNLDFMSHCECIVSMSEKFYNYRYNPSSISHKVKPNAFKISKNLLAYLIAKVDTLGLGNDGRYRVQRMFIGTSRATVGLILKSALPKSEKACLLDEICNDSTLKDVAKEYPVSKMPIKHRLFFMLTINNNQTMLKLLSKFMH